MNYGIVRYLCNIYQYTCIKHATKAYGEINETNKTFEVIFQSLIIHNFLSNIYTCTYNIDRIRTTEVEALERAILVGHWHFYERLRQQFSYSFHQCRKTRQCHKGDLNAIITPPPPSLRSIWDYRSGSIPKQH